MIVYFLSTESFMEYEDAERLFYSGRIPHNSPVNVMSAKDGQIIAKGSIKSVINKLKYM